MGTITLGGRELAVQPMPRTLGSIKWRVRWRERFAAEKDLGAQVDLRAEYLLRYLGHNEGVTADWLLDNVPDDARETMAAVRRAAGEDAAPGEASRP